MRLALTLLSHEEPLHLALFGGGFGRYMDMVGLGRWVREGEAFTSEVRATPGGITCHHGVL
jgi:hypothetical protein